MVILALLLAATGQAHADAIRLALRARGSGEALAQGWAEVGGQRLPADASGVVLLDLAPGRHLVPVGAPEHLSLEVPIEVPGPAEVQVFLRPDVPPAEIVVEARRPSPHVSRQVLDRERVEQTPGAFDDPVRLLQSLPGVAVTREFGDQVGQVAIRGAAPAESRFFVDGVELPYLYHFDNYASVVPIRVLDEVAMYPSGFGPAYGDVVGGVVAAATRPPDRDRAHGGVDVNLIMAGAHASVPVGESVAISASARRSYLDLVESGNDQYTVWPVFYDYTGRVDWQPSPDHALSVIGLGAGDAYGRYAGDTAALDPLEAAAAEVFDSDRDFQALLVEARNRTGSASLHTVLSGVHDDWRASLATAAQQVVEREVALRHEALLLLGAHELALGGDGRHEVVDVGSDTDRAWPELGAEAPLLERGVALDQRRARQAGGVYVEPRLALGPARVSAGLRAQGDTSVAGGPALDPRLSVQLALPRDVQVRAAGGRYSQAPEAVDQALAGVELGWITAEHAVLGVDLAVAGRWELGVEGWGRWLHDTIALDPAGEGVEVVDGQALGVELTSRYRLRERFFTSASVALARARRGGVAFAYDQPYAVNLVASWDFAPGWNAGARWRYAAGTPYTDVVDAIYDGDADRYLPVEGAPYGQRMADYQKLDLHLERQWAWRTWEVDLYLELWWVPPGNNTLYPVYSYDYSEQAFVVGPPLVPLVGLRAGF